MKKVIISILVILLLVIGIVIGIHFAEKYILINSNTTIREAIGDVFIKEEVKKEKDEPIVVELEKKEDIKVSMSVIGDIMCHNSQYNDAHRNGEYDFSYVFEDVKEYIVNLFLNKFKFILQMLLWNLILLRVLLDH